MTRNSLILAVAVAVIGPAALTPPAHAQTLDQRLDHVRRRHAAPTEAPRALSTRERVLQTVLHRTVDVDFNHTPVRDAFETLQTMVDLQIVVRYADDAVGHGIDPDTPIVLDVRHLPLVDVIERMLEQCEAVEPCTWQIRRSYLEIGTKARLGLPAAQEIRAYPIDDVLFQAPRYDNAPQFWLESGYGYYPPAGAYGRTYAPSSIRPSVNRPVGPGQTYGSTLGAVVPSTADRDDRAQSVMDLITDLIEPQAWEANGGTWATLRYQDGVLIVRAPDFVHRQIGGYPHVAPPAPAMTPATDADSTPTTTTAPTATGATPTP
ncbi:MAG: hypothetical protein KDA25_07575 [Phycisphaerales bacterium]|nr:hypothetical protein [Phycisphaerales bacterium]